MPVATFITRVPGSDGGVRLAVKDLIDVAGVRAPMVTAPLATYTGWNPRRHVDELPDVLYERIGSKLPFPPGRPSVVGLRRAPLRKSSSMNLRKASLDRIWRST